MSVTRSPASSPAINVSAVAILGLKLRRNVNGWSIPHCIISWWKCWESKITRKKDSPLRLQLTPIKFNLPLAIAADPMMLQMLQWTQFTRIFRMESAMVVPGRVIICLLVDTPIAIAELMILSLRARRLLLLLCPLHPNEWLFFNTIIAIFNFFVLLNQDQRLKIDWAIRSLQNVLKLCHSYGEIRGAIAPGVCLLFNADKTHHRR